MLEKTDANKEEEQNDDRLLWTINETAKQLALSQKSVRRLIDKGEIAFIKFERAIRIEKQSVYHFIEAHRQYNSGCVESAVRDPTGERLCRIEISKTQRWKYLRKSVLQDQYHNKWSKTTTLYSGENLKRSEAVRGQMER